MISPDVVLEDISKKSNTGIWDGTTVVFIMDIFKRLIRRAKAQVYKTQTPKTRLAQKDQPKSTLLAIWLPTDSKNNFKKP